MTIIVEDLTDEEVATLRTIVDAQATIAIRAVAPLLDLELSPAI